MTMSIHNKTGMNLSWSVTSKQSAGVKTGHMRGHGTVPASETAYGTGVTPDPDATYRYYQLNIWPTGYEAIAPGRPPVALRPTGTTCSAVNSRSGSPARRSNTRPRITRRRSRR